MGVDCKWIVGKACGELESETEARIHLVHLQISRYNCVAVAKKFCQRDPPVSSSKPKECNVTNAKNPVSQIQNLTQRMSKVYPYNANN
ncbi:hypothetical protein G7K_5523-t1 [Saitoella complicata NRRL Y-17804]|uniref:Uncharacterized protein n=1 Tax=Saitoella complicata (strain BCRC 22490 / CBS 7301 / JCM 7358 / NBRC 10748 / NRRL Y-17804) TaxID=698492 RepID=A0A0E9NNH9_SAICN|nr:hypothetical protein G7K_5523-t1 [Saitoella complicata NRRL Y-17804]